MKKTLSIIGIMVGFLFVLVGILSAGGALGGDTSNPTSAPYSYDSGYATFGADYYTYSVNNTAEAAAAARAAAYNTVDIAEFLCLAFGLASILFGFVVMCGFGIVLSTCAQNIPNDTNNATPGSDSEAVGAEEVPAE